MRSRIVILLVIVLAASAMPLPVASSAPTAVNTAVASVELQAALDGASSEDLKVIVLMKREFTRSDVAFLKEHDARLYGRITTLPAALIELSPEGVIALSWRDGVKRLDLERPLEYLGNTAVVSTNAAAVWGGAGKPGVTAANPLLDASGSVIDGRGVTVAVIDSGIDATHPDLKLGDKVVVNKKHVCATPGLINPGSGRCFGNWLIDDLLENDAGQEPLGPVFVDTVNSDTSSAHGTHVAGIVAGDGTASAGKYQGSAPGAKLVGIGVGEGLSIFGIIEAIDWVYRNADNTTALNGERIRVVTNSYGEFGGARGTQSDIEFQLIKKAIEEKGLVFTFAAGNDGNDGTDRTSSYCDYSHWLPGLLCVANGDDHGVGARESMTLAPSSSRGDPADVGTWPDVTAPGSRIVSTWSTAGPLGFLGIFSDQNPYYTHMSGTSMATPHVAGVAALLLQADPTLTPGQVEDLLESTALKFTFGAAYNADGTSVDKGHGLVDAQAAVESVLASTTGGSALHGITGAAHIYQQGFNPFVVTKQFTTVPSGTTVTASIRSAAAAPWDGTDLATATGAFRLVNATGDVVESGVLPYTGTESEDRFSADWLVEAPQGDYLFQVLVDGRLVDVIRVRVVGDAAATDPVTSECTTEVTGLSFTPDGPVLEGFVTGTGLVDKVRVDVLRDGKSIAWGLDARQSAVGLDAFAVPLPSATALAGAELGVTVLAADVPCLATLHVPAVTPDSLASTQPAGLVQIGNPWLNPGFELTTGAEVQNGAMPAPGYQATMVAPPTVMQAEGDPDNKIPYSTAEVVANGSSGNALLVHYDARDDDRNLLIGQVFGAEGAPYQWVGADTVSFEYKTEDALTDFHVNVHYKPVDGNATWLTKSSGAIAATDAWTRVTFDVSGIPENATITMATIRIRGDVDTNVSLDNVRITGSTFSIVDLHSDVSDGYSMIVHPESNVQTGSFQDTLNLSPFVTGKGEAYVAQTKLRDFTAITPEWVDARNAKYFIFAIAGKSYVENGWGTKGLERDVRGAVKADGSAVAFGVDKAATLAQTDNGLGIAYAYWNISEVRASNDRLVYSGEGYYSALKNSVQNYSLADQLDAAVTPVRVLDEPAENEIEGLGNASVVVTVPNGGNGGFSVRIDPPMTGWIEKTTLSVTGYPDRTVVLDGSGESFFVNYEGNPNGVRAVLEGTLFVRGDAFASGNPVPTFFTCRAPDHAAAHGCRDKENRTTRSLEEVHFDASESRDPQGQGLQYQWDFGDGSGAKGAKVTHVFTKPGDHQVTLTVTDATGATETASTIVTVLNRAPEVKLNAPAIATRADDLMVSVDGSDADGTVESIVVLFDGAQIATLQGPGTVTIPKADLTLGEHELVATATDDSGDTTTQVVAFTVENLAPVPGLTASATLVGVGDAVTFTPAGSDPDSSTLTLTLAFGDGASANVTHGEPVTHTFVTGGVFPVTLTADDGEGGVGTVTLRVVVDGTAPVTTASVEDGAWHTANVTVHLAAVDDHSTTTTFYKIDDGTFTEYTEAFEVGGDGTYTVTYYSVDALGNAEAPQSVTVRIDSGVPVIDASGMPQDFEVVAGERTLSASATDDVSGMQSLRILIDGEECAAGASEATCTWDTTEALVGFFELTVEATDVAGNTASRSVLVFVSNGLVLPASASIPALL